MAQDQPKQTRIGGFTGPSETVLEKRRNLVRAFDVMHAALVDVLEELPEGCVSTLARKVKGDTIKIAFKVGKAEEAEEPEEPEEPGKQVPRLTV